MRIYIPSHIWKDYWKKKKKKEKNPGDPYVCLYRKIKVILLEIELGIKRFTKEEEEKVSKRIVFASEISTDNLIIK